MEEDSKRTESGLYRTSREVLGTFFRDYFEREKEKTQHQFIKEIASRIEREDSELGIFFQQAYEDMDVELAEVFVSGAGLMYELLRRQAESNSLSERLG